MQLRVGVAPLPFGGGAQFSTTIFGTSVENGYIQFGVCHLRIYQDKMTRTAKKPSAVIKQLDK
jgi:hypothetical protein